MRQPQGFTLIELLLVMAIGVTLMAVSATAISWYVRKANEYETVRAIDALLRQAPQLASRTGCWSELELIHKGPAQRLKLTACGQVAKEIDLPADYQITAKVPDWQIPFAQNTPPKDSAAPNTAVQIWLSPSAGLLPGMFSLQKGQTHIANFPPARQQAP